MSNFTLGVYNSGTKELCDAVVAQFRQHLPEMAEDEEDALLERAVEMAVGAVADELVKRGEESAIAWQKARDFYRK